MKLTQIGLQDFRAFPGQFKLPLNGGCNLLLYGENGSGKSSLSMALREFIALDRPLPRPISTHAHVFPDPAQKQPKVQLTFDVAGTPEDIIWESGRLHPLELDDAKTPASTTKAQRERLIAVSRQSGFFDYRALLKTSYRSGDSDLPRQLFGLFVENLLGGFPLGPGSGEMLRQRWTKLQGTVPKNRHDRRIREANEVAEPLNTALNGFLEQTRVEANRLLATHFPNHRLVIVSLATPGCRFRKETKELIGQSLQTEIEYNGRKVTRHEDFLNEARLTALGLAMFLGALKLADSNPADADALRLLVLDDVLIGLDIANRMPLLELLRIEFPHHQTVLLTHDELWFDIARGHIQHWGSWKAAQLFAEDVGPNDPPIPRLKSDMDDLVLAKRHLDRAELLPAATYVRSAFENRLRSIAEERHIKIDFKRDVKKVTADMLWTALLAKHAELVANTKAFLNPALLPRIEAVRSQVLNRLAHGGLGLQSQDVQSAIDALKAFRTDAVPFIS